MTKFEIKYFAARIEMDEYLDLDSANISKDPLMSRELSHTFEIQKNQNLTRRLSGLEILNNATLIIQKWLVSRLFANIFYHPLIENQNYRFS